MKNPWYIADFFITHTAADTQWRGRRVIASENCVGDNADKQLPDSMTELIVGRQNHQFCHQPEYHAKPELPADVREDGPGLTDLMA